MEILLFTLDLVKKQNAVKNQPNGKKRKSSTKRNTRIQFSNAKENVSTIQWAACIFGFRTGLADSQATWHSSTPARFFCTSNRHQFSWNRVPLAKTSSWKYDDIFFRITMFPEEPTTTLNLAPVRWGHQALCEMGSGSSSLAFFCSHLWMPEVKQWNRWGMSVGLQLLILTQVSVYFVVCTCQERAQEAHYDFDDAQGLWAAVVSSTQSSGPNYGWFPPPMIDFRRYLWNLLLFEVCEVIARGWFSNTEAVFCAFQLPH